MWNFWSVHAHDVWEYTQYTLLTMDLHQSTDLCGGSMQRNKTMHQQNAEKKTASMWTQYSFQNVKNIYEYFMSKKGPQHVCVWPNENIVF